MHHRAGCAVGIVVVAAAIAATTCDGAEGDVCEPGAVEGCSCSVSGALGSRHCQGDGIEWSPCECASADGDGDGDHDSDLDGDHDGDGDTDSGPVGGGPLTFVISGASVIAERIFDIDGDGSPDNAVANLGADTAALFALMLDALFDSASLRGSRNLVHFPWVEELGSLTDPSVVMINATGQDLDDPENRDDDLSGTEPFYASSGALDACGEPLDYYLDASLTDGVLNGANGSFTISSGDASGFAIYNAIVRGSFSTDGSTNETLIGGAVLISELGDSYAAGASEDHSLLEILLSGGAILGVGALPGLEPDLDLDGDGLESFELDTESHIVRCIDGDRTVFEGRDCWRDATFADAISLTLRLGLVHAVFAGREPGWEGLVPGECSDPPEESLFDER